MSQPMFAVKPFSALDFLSQRNQQVADDTVAEVFGMMFGFSTETFSPAVSDVTPGDADERTAIVGFSGTMRGSCEIRMNYAAALSIASAMLGGMPVDEADNSIDDAMGELCNMLAGGWKNRVPDLASDCSLSPPTVISGRDYKVHVRMPSHKLCRSYRFDGQSFHMILHREDQSEKA